MQIEITNVINIMIDCLDLNRLLLDLKEIITINWLMKDSKNQSVWKVNMKVEGSLKELNELLNKYGKKIK